MGEPAGPCIPVVVILHIIGQFMWGRRVHEVGVGPEPVSRSKLTAGRLAAALSQVLQDDQLLKVYPH